MKSLKPYFKSLLAGGAAIVYTIGAALSDENITNSEWVAIITLIGTTAGVFTVRNAPVETGRGARADGVDGGVF